MVELSNPKNWKKTHQKSFDGHLCLPPLGTQFYCDELGTNTITTNTRRFVLRYKNGFMQAIDINTVINKLRTPSGEVITKEYLENKSNQGTVPWIPINVVPDNTTLLAFHIPCKCNNDINIRIGNLLVNRYGADHGDGDYIVCPVKNDNKPDLKRAVVINGVLFPLLYDIRGIGASVKAKIYIMNTNKKEEREIPEIFNLDKELDFCEEFIVELCKLGIDCVSIEQDYSSRYDGEPNPDMVCWWNIKLRDESDNIRLTYKYGNRYSVEYWSYDSKNNLEETTVSTPRIAALTLRNHIKYKA